MASLSLYLDHRRKSKSGLHSIKIRISHLKKTVYFSSEVKIPSNDWDIGKQRVRTSNPLYKEFNLTLATKLTELQKIVLEFESQNLNYSSKDIKVEKTVKVYH